MPPVGKLQATPGLTRELLAWLVDRPRTYGDAMEVWGTQCAAYPVWEDALADGLVELAPGEVGRMRDRGVRATSRGRAMADGKRRH